MVSIGTHVSLLLFLGMCVLVYKIVKSECVFVFVSCLFEYVFFFLLCALKEGGNFVNGRGELLHSYKLCLCIWAELDQVCEMCSAQIK